MLVLLAGVGQDLGGADATRPHRIIARLLASQAVSWVHLRLQVPSTSGFMIMRDSLLLIPGDLVLDLASFCRQKVPCRRISLIFLSVKSHF